MEKTTSNKGYVFDNYSTNSSYYLLVIIVNFMIIQLTVKIPVSLLSYFFVVSWDRNSRWNCQNV